MGDILPTLLLVVSSAQYLSVSQSLFRPPPADCTLVPGYIARVFACLQRDEVPDYNNFKCYKVAPPEMRNEKCGAGELLVVSSICSDYPSIKCRAPVLSNGTACPAYAPLVYRDACRPPADRCGQGNRRLEADIYGEVSCVCPAMLGYLQWTDGRCYHEYMRGPCPEGEQLVRGNNSIGCVRHNCRAGRVRWEDGVCYEVEQAAEDCSHMYELHPRVPVEDIIVSLRNNRRLAELLTLQCQDISPHSSEFDPFDNCLIRAADSTCLKKKRQPRLLAPGDLRKILLKQFEKLKEENWE